MREPIRVPTAVYAGLDAIRRSGQTNMFARAQVIRLAAALGFADTAAWVEAYPEQYLAGVLAGFIPDDGTEGGQ